MAYPIAPGGDQAYGSSHPEYSGTFIPEIWAAKLVENFYDTTVLAQISNTDYEGVIKKHGDAVNIRTTPTVSINPYRKGEELIVEKPESNKLQLLIDQGDYFNVVEDDVDKVQSDVNLMDLWTKDASENFKITIDTKVLSGILPDIDAKNQGSTAGYQSEDINLGTVGNPVVLTKANVLDYIVDIGVVLREANVPEMDNFLVIPAKMGGLIKKSDLQDASIAGDNTSIVRSGRIGMIDNFTLYVSHNLKRSTGGPIHIIAGQKMGLTFASQMTNVENLRSEKTFGTIIRGLQVYGYKVTKGQALATGVITI